MQLSENDQELVSSDDEGTEYGIDEEVISTNTGTFIPESYVKSPVKFGAKGPTLELVQPRKGERSDLTEDMMEKLTERIYNMPEITFKANYPNEKAVVEAINRFRSQPVIEKWAQIYLFEHLEAIARIQNQ